MKNEEKRYYVTEDRQGDFFGKYRIYTIEQWREQAKEWCDYDGNDDLWEYMDKLPKDQVIDFIDDMWDITLKETTFTTELLQKAFKHYNKLQKIISKKSNKSLIELCDELGGYMVDETFFELDWKEMLVTISERNGKIVLDDIFDLWNGKTNEKWVNFSIDELEEYI